MRWDGARMHLQDTFYDKHRREFKNRRQPRGQKTAQVNLLSSYNPNMLIKYIIHKAVQVSNPKYNSQGQMAKGKVKNTNWVETRISKI